MGHQLKYHLDITQDMDDDFPTYWENYLVENELYGKSTSKMERHLSINHKGRFCHKDDTYERWLEFESDEDRTMFVLRYS